MCNILYTHGINFDGHTVDEKIGWKLYFTLGLYWTLQVVFTPCSHFN